ncbi:MAG: helix-turn-helix transcriptional regulator [Acidimicrobiia bacterium]|nr:helix-turn-helix transcriptional regulator [Acidimicrobiia bacterium]
MPTAVNPKPLAPLPSEALRSRLLDLRNKRGWTQDEVASRMDELGYSWVRSTVAKVELGQRGVTVDELVALAYVLGASPAALLVANAGPARIAPNIATSTENLWRWMTGAKASGGRRIDPKRKVPQVPPDPASVDRRFYLEACPDFVFLAETRLSGLRNLIGTIASVQSLAGAELETTDDRSRVLAAIDHLLEGAETDIALLRHRARVEAEQEDQP